MQTFTIIYYACSYLFVIECVLDMVLYAGNKLRLTLSDETVPPLSYRVYQELLPFTWMMCVVISVRYFARADGAGDTIVGVFFVYIAVYWWRRWVRNKDDRWGRRGRRAKKMLAALVPATRKRQLAFSAESA